MNCSITTHHFTIRPFLVSILHLFHILIEPFSLLVIHITSFQGKSENGCEKLAHQATKSFEIIYLLSLL